MDLSQIEVQDLPNGRFLTVALLISHPAMEVKSVVARLENRYFQLALVEGVDPAAFCARLRPVYRIPFPTEIKCCDVDVSINFTNGPSYTKRLEYGSGLNRFLYNLRQRLERRKAKSLRRAKRRKHVRSPLTWDSVSSRVMAFFLLHIWPRWVRLVYHKKVCFFTITSAERIGHLASESEILFCEMEKKVRAKAKACLILKRETFVEDVGLVRIDQKIKQSYLVKMLKRRHFVVDLKQRDFSRLAKFHASWRVHQHRDIYGVLDLTAPRLSFTAQETNEAWRQLRRLGLTPETPFVCVHLRESGYIQKLYNLKHFPQLRYSYRDVTKESFVPTMEYLMDQGFKVVRLGVPPVDPCSIADERYIDYANVAQSQFLDLFLCSQCSFFLGTTSGLYALADLFRKPILFTNFAPLRHIHSWSVRYLTIPKVAYYQKLERLLTLEEMLIRGFGDVIHGEKIEGLGIDYVANTEEDILEGTKEMVARLRNTWEESPGDWSLQERFWRMLSRDELNLTLRSRVSAHFLRKYEMLLPPLPKDRVLTCKNGTAPKRGRAQVRANRTPRLYSQEEL